MNDSPLNLQDRLSAVEAERDNLRHELAEVKRNTECAAGMAELVRQRRDELEAERDNLKADLDNALDTREFLFAATREAQEIAAAALAKRDALRADAERWRHARLTARHQRAHDQDWIVLGAFSWPKTGHATTPDYADAAIDAARAAMKGTQA